MTKKDPSKDQDGRWYVRVSKDDVLKYFRENDGDDVQKRLENLEVKTGRLNIVETRLERQEIKTNELLEKVDKLLSLLDKKKCKFFYMYYTTCSR